MAETKLKFAVVLLSLANVSSKYTPDWASLDSRITPGWYDDAKIGIFIHWGVFSVPSFSSEVFWESWKSAKILDLPILSFHEYLGNCSSCNEFMKRNYKPGFTYQEFASKFSAEFFRPTDWADLFERAGARYVILTSKHCDGYTLFPSKSSFGWNSLDVGPGRDLVLELGTTLRNQTSLRFGLYYCLYEPFHPLWMKDKANQFKTDDFIEGKVLPNLREIVESYAPDILWTDGEWEASSQYWKSTQFLAWLFNESKVKEFVVINDRWGNETRGRHGGIWTGGDRLNPGFVLPHKWENCMTLDKLSWGYRRNANLDDYLSPQELITTLVETVSCGGNLLVNVGPTKDGIIDIIQQERLLEMGEWLKINGPAIYGSAPWREAQNDTVTKGVWYTSNKETVFAFLTFWPGKTVQLGSVNYNADLTIGMLGYGGKLLYEPSSPGIKVHLPKLEGTRSKYVWTLTISKPCDINKIK
ncbi:Alpha-L-fucosidase [Folsomia candida]|uniref:Putative alpha-L-fucosidase n=1 Tax=Folsomia candida TaxID=158441 RepID=A0A226ED73_FOLCA|nr:Alpha-L-fucosidase [Folsomia candida]